MNIKVRLLSQSATDLHWELLLSWLGPILPDVSILVLPLLVDVVTVVTLPDLSIVVLLSVIIIIIIVVRYLVYIYLK